MIGRVLGVALTILKLPIKLVLLPFKLVSAIMSLLLYAVLLAGIGGAVYLFVL